MSLPSMYIAMPDWFTDKASRKNRVVSSVELKDSSLIPKYSKANLLLASKHKDITVVPLSIILSKQAADFPVTRNLARRTKEPWMAAKTLDSQKCQERWLVNFRKLPSFVSKSVPFLKMVTFSNRYAKSWFILRMHIGLGRVRSGLSVNWTTCSFFKRPHPNKSMSLSSKSNQVLNNLKLYWWTSSNLRNLTSFGFLGRWACKAQNKAQKQEAWGLIHFWGKSRYWMLLKESRMIL